MEYTRYSGDLRELNLKNGDCAALAGLSPSALAYMLPSLLKAHDHPVFILVPNAIAAEDLAGDLEFFWPEGKSKVHLFPALESKPFMAQATDLDSLARRNWALSQLASADGSQVIIAPAASALRLVPSPADTLSRFKRIISGSECDMEELKIFLLQNGYVNSGQVESRGDFSARGDIVDIYPAGSCRPVRIEFFGDFVESIRSFNIQDQRSIDKLNEILITPVFEFNYDPNTGEVAAEILQDMAMSQAWHSLLWEPIATRLNQAEMFSGLESWAPLFTHMVPLQNYFSKNIFTVVYEPEECENALDAAWLNISNHFDRLAGEERPHLPLERLFQKPYNLCDSLLQPSGGSWRVRGLEIADGNKNAVHLRLPFEPNTGLSALTALGRSGSGILGPLAARIRSLLGRGINVNLVTRTAEQSKRLAGMLTEYDLSAQAPLSGRGKQALLSFKVGQLSTGFAAPFMNEAYISEEEIFGAHNKRRRRATQDLKGLNFTSLKDLSPGDFVVHNIHGIGQYLGLVTLNLSYGQKGDFLHLSYKGGDKLYVPVELFSAVGKYIGAHDHPPSLDKLGGLTWGRLKEKVKENIRQMAEELLKLYASRKVAPGHSYTGRDQLFNEFEASFEYTDTPDQRKAVDETIADLEAPQPMDRLICGDVGYGKTEVAMRAAFKVASEGRQVAVLVPTTILADQHGRSFEERLSPWGFTVTSLSRFKKPAEIKEILKNASEGKVDVVIGTHRLLQKDVKFKNLGLVIIDEEHRFGVADKEKLKKMRTSVDVLAMSATPIPRSLSMALSGIRDLSSITTPPQDRLAVKTSLLKYEDEAVCEAIDRELARGGQTFIIHNRVKDIHLWAARLRKLMPLVRVAIGHGQMKEAELEETMRAFLNREIDVWITTTIVESGLDFPSAGTIIINQADRFGLAQLYQLRGRVGRGNQQAYAYLMVDNPDTLTQDAKKRLKAILDHSELGSGYQISMHDLQIRGSGNILGAAQSGQAQLVGYEMYTQLMEQAISEIKGEEYDEDFDPEVSMGLPAYLPEAYVPDTESRLVLYRRLSSVKSQDEIEALIEEMRDRFGQLPPEGENLTNLMEIKLMLKKARVRKLESGPGGLTLTFGEKGPANYDKVIELVTSKNRQIRLSPSGKLFVGDVTLKTSADFNHIKKLLPSLV